MKISSQIASWRAWDKTFNLFLLYSLKYFIVHQITKNKVNIKQKEGIFALEA